MLSNRAYDILKWIAQIALPALAALYIGLSKYWAIPYPSEISGTIMTVDLFLGALLGISSAKYNEEHESSANKE